MIYSNSRLTTFEQCPLKFKYKYIDKIPELEKSIESHLGKVVHSTLEWLYLQVKKNKIPTIDEIITYYIEEWDGNYHLKTTITKKEFTAKDYFNKGIKFILDYYLNNKPFKDNTLEVEKKITINLDKEGRYKIQGFIDRLVHNLEKDEYEIHDYKTSNTFPEQEKIDADRQLALYAIAIKELFGVEKEICLTWHYLAHNKKIRLRKTNIQLEQLKKDTIELINKIESTTDFAPTKSSLCGWCEYKSICGAHKK